MEGDHVTLSGHGSGSLGNEWGDNQLGQSPRVPRLSEAAQPITPTSDMMPGKTDNGGPDRLICKVLLFENKTTVNLSNLACTGREILCQISEIT